MKKNYRYHKMICDKNGYCILAHDEDCDACKNRSVHFYPKGHANDRNIKKEFMPLVKINK